MPRSGHPMRDIAARIGAKIAAGLLPLATEPRQRIGKGSGSSCAGCDESITRADVEYEVSIGSRRMLRFHSDCLMAWKDGRYEHRPDDPEGPMGVLGGLDGCAEGEGRSLPPP